MRRNDTDGKSLQEPFSRLRESIKVVTAGKILNMSIDKVCVSADKSRLVGVSSFTSDILGYGCSKREKSPLMTIPADLESEKECCKTSVSVVLGKKCIIARSRYKKNSSCNKPKKSDSRVKRQMYISSYRFLPG